MTGDASPVKPEPAFRSRWQLGLFLAATITALLFPFLPKAGWLDRSRVYLTLDGRRGNYLYLANDTMRDKTDIDVLFLGHSGIEAGTDPLMVRKALAPILKRQPVVVTIGHTRENSAFDYVALKDLYLTRRVKMVILQRNMTSAEKFSSSLNNSAYLWDTQLHREVLSQFPFREQAAVYLNNVTGSLRLLTLPFRSQKGNARVEFCPDVGRYLGGCPRALRSRMQGEAVRTMPSPPQLPLEKLMHYRERPGSVLRQEGVATDLDRVMIDAMFRMTAEQGTKLVFLQVPHDVTAATDLDRVLVPRMEAGERGADAPILGVALADLYPNERATDIVARYFIDNPGKHFHFKAASHFTAVMMPAILAAFQDALGTSGLPP